MNYNKTNITYTLIFYVIFQKLNMNEMDIDVNDLNEIDRKLNVEVSSDNDMQIICKECSQVIEDIAQWAKMSILVSPFFICKNIFAKSQKYFSTFVK